MSSFESELYVVPSFFSHISFSLLLFLMCINYRVCRIIVVVVVVSVVSHSYVDGSEFKNALSELPRSLNTNI